MKLLIHTALCLALLPMGVKAIDTTEMAAVNGFTENKGQITDQYNRPRKDIDYKMAAAGVTLYIGNGQLHYQWSRTTTGSKGDKAQPTTIYRMDVELVGADKNAVAIAEAPHSYTENYYLPQCPNGITAGSYGRITYKDVYPNIDWVLYAGEDGGMKYDFVVHPGGNPAQIKLRYSGATALQLRAGTAMATTPYGSITEGAPYSYMQGSRAPVPSSYLIAGTELSYAIGDYDHSQTLVIDPSVAWATYYGGGTEDPVFKTAADTAGNSYLFTYTGSANLATSGAHQTTITIGAILLVKFNQAGQRQWSTYFGNMVAHEGAICTHTDGSIYIGGETETSTGIATTGAFMTSNPSFPNPFGMLAKFNSSGIRQWSTYYPTSVSVLKTDFTGNLYIGGICDDTIRNYATAGAFQTTKAQGFISKMSADGSRLWSTYFNGFIYGLAVDHLGSFFISGTTTFTTGVGTAGTFQPSLTMFSAGAFVAKFDTSGSRQWGSYFDGVYAPAVRGPIFTAVACDGNGNAYLTAESSIPGVATAGTHQTTMGSAYDGLLVKFDGNGNRVWATYYGGDGYEYLEDVVVGPRNRVYICGSTYSTNNISTAGSYQPTLAGTNGWSDAFMAVFDSNGIRQYGTYYGGNHIDWADGLAYGNGRVYMAGVTRSSGIATTGAHQTSLSGNANAFLVSFDLDSFLYIKEPLPDVVLCGGDTLVIPYEVTKPFRSGNTFNIELSNSSGSFASPTLLATHSAQMGDTVTYVVPMNVTAGSDYRVRVISTGPIDTVVSIQRISLNPRPVVNAGNNIAACTGNPLNLTASSSVSGVAWSWTGPASFTAAVNNPVRNPVQLSHSGDYYVTATLNGCSGKDTVAVTVSQTPELTSATSNSPVCANGNIELNATGNTPGTVWSWSGPGGFTAAVEDTTLVSVPVSAGGTYTVTATLGSCSTKIDVPVTVVSGPTVAIYPSPNDSICTGTSVTFVAVPTNPGAAPQYQWMLNNNPISGATGTRYTTTSIATGDEVKVVLTPGAGAACATVVNSNAIPVTVLPYLAPSVSMTATDDNAWPGLQVDFVATTTDAGSAPKYQWKLNNVNVQGATSNKWGSAALNNGDSVCIEITSSYLCPQPKTAVACKRVKIATGIGNVDAASGIRIYPNPTSDKLVIEGVGKGTAITITDITGREVYSTTASESNALVTTAALVPGNYLLQLQTAAGKRYRQKIVVSR